MHAHRWSTGILLVVAGFLLTIGLVMGLRDRGGPEAPSDASPTSADYRIKEVRLREETESGTRWQLDADQAEVFEEAGRTALKNIVLTVEDKGQTWTVSGEEGDLIQASKDVELRGNVVVVSSDGLRLETARLHWDGAAERAWTEDTVTVHRPGAVVTGTGLEAWIREETLVIAGRVRATLSAPPAGGEPRR